MWNDDQELKIPSARTKWYSLALIAGILSLGIGSALHVGALAGNSAASEVAAESAAALGIAVVFVACTLFIVDAIVVRSIARVMVYSLLAVSLIGCIVYLFYVQTLGPILVRLLVSRG
jgi:hypothetical protein